MSISALRTLWLDREGRCVETIRSLLRAEAEAPLEAIAVRSVGELHDRLVEDPACASVVRVTATPAGVRDVVELRERHSELPIVIVSDGDQDAAALFAAGAQELLLLEELDVGSVLRALHCAMDRMHIARATPTGGGGASRISFGEFELDPRRLELRRDGALVKVHPTPMRLLVHLVENADRVVSKDELLEAVWAGTVVSDFAISSALKDLRHVLDDDGVRQRYIQTLRGSGYRFVAPQITGPEEALASDVALLAVLPFADLSDDAACAGLAAGLRDALVESLSRLDTLRVLSAASASSLPGRHASALALARELGVDAVVMGSVRAQRERLRISVQLLDPIDGGLIWADHFEHERDAEPGAEEELARVVASRIAFATTPHEPVNGRPSRTQEPEAYETCLLAQYHHRRGTPESLAVAQREYERAIEQAPSYPLPYVGLARVLLALCGYTRLAPQRGAAVPREIALPRAIRNVGQALALDPMLGKAHAVRGTALGAFEWQWAEAKMALDRAVELSPGDADCVMEQAKLMSGMGRTDWAVDAGQQAVDLDPLNVPLRVDHARLLRLARRHEDALREQLRIMEMDPGFAAVHSDLGTTYEELGRHAEAVDAWLRLLKLVRFPRQRLAALQHAFENDGIAGYWRAWIEIASSETYSRYLPSEWLWVPYARLRDFDRAFQWLDHAIRRRSEVLAYVNVDPSFDVLREDARFGLLQKQVGIPS